MKINNFIIHLIFTIIIVTTNQSCTRENKGSQKSMRKINLPTASRPAPPKLDPIIIGAKKYEVVFGSTQGKVQASDNTSQEKLWSIELYSYKHNKINGLEADIQNVFIQSIEKFDNNSIALTDSRKKVYVVNLDDRSFKIIKWPVYLNISNKNPLTVELTISNDTDKTIELDFPSIAYGGELSNNLFELEADGVKIDYNGMMKKRAMPDKFYKLKSGEIYKIKIDLTQEYKIPNTYQEILIKFEQTNHFSKHDFVMYSPTPLVVKK